MLSIIVPIYNTEKYLKQCIDSILAQTFKEFELLLIDDGSTDKSWEICCEYEKIDSRIKIYQKQNSGVSATRNFGLEKAKGEYISFCDSDDILDYRLYELLIKKMNMPSVDRVCGGYKYLYDDGHTLFCKPRKKDGIYLRDDLLNIMIDDGTLSGFLFSGVNNSIFRKEIIDEYIIRFDESIRYNEDSLFSFEYALHARGLYSYQSQALYSYRQHQFSATKKVVKNKYILLHQRLDEMQFDKEATNYRLQMKRREITELLWDILEISRDENGIKAIKQIKKLLSRGSIIENFETLDIPNMNCYKKVYYFLMKKKMAYTLYFITKKLLPVLSKYLQR